MGVLFAMAGCRGPNLQVQSATADFTAKTVNVTVRNAGDSTAGPQLTYIELNAVGAADSLKPQSQNSANVPAISAGSSWNSGPIPFSSFSVPPNRGLGDINALTAANLVVTADAKNMVVESIETDNVSSTNQP
jgi:hypothetical protein